MQHNLGFNILANENESNTSYKVNDCKSTILSLFYISYLILVTTANINSLGTDLKLDSYKEDGSIDEFTVNFDLESFPMQISILITDQEYI
jgi:hypothetical protein